MENLIYNISQVLGITLIHSLWQSLINYFMLRLAFAVSPRLSASAKYLLGVSSLIAVTGWFILTLANQIQVYHRLSDNTGSITKVAFIAGVYASPGKFDHQSVSYYYSIREYMPWITMAYIAGLLFNLARLMTDRRKINLVKQTMSIDINLQTKVLALADMLNIAQPVKIGLSKLVDVPCMIGYLKPVILLPFTLSTYLGTEEIEAILLHELTHIRRNDYLINLLQQFISTLLFFNPCARLINQIINDERENCCDDEVIKSASSPVVYAKALLKLEQTRDNNIRLALSASGRKYHLLNRIERIMQTRKSKINFFHPVFAFVLLAVSFGCIAWLNPKINANAPLKKIKPAAPVTRDFKMFSAVAPEPHLKKDKTIHLVIDSIRRSVNDTVKHKKIKIVVEDEQGNKKEYDSPEQLPQSDRNEFFKADRNFDTTMASWNRLHESDEWKKQMKDMTDDMQQKFNSPEWKKQMKDMGDDMAKKFNNPEWKKQMLAMSEDMKKKFGNPEWKKQAKQMSEDMVKKFDTPEWKKQMKDMTDELQKKFNNPEWRKQMKAMSDDMQKKFNSPEWKKQMIERQKQWKKNFNFNFPDSLKTPEATDTLKKF